MANSLAQQRDLNLKDDYEQRLYGKLIGSQPYDAHVNFKLVDASSNSWYSIHSPGLPIILAPILSLLGLKGVVTSMIMAGVLLCSLTYVWCKKLTGNNLASLVATGSLFLSVMYLNLVGYILVDMVIAVILLGVLLLLIDKEPRPAWWRYLLIGSLSGLSIWIHVKTGLMALTILAIALYQIARLQADMARRIKLASALLIPFALIVLGLSFKLHQWFGVWLPNQIYQGNDQMFQLSPLTALSAIFFDSFKGIFTPNPAFLLIFSGLPIWWRKNKKSLVYALLIVMPSFIIQSTFDDWAGGWSPSGRYPIEILPLFIPAIAFSLIYMRSRLARLLQATLLGVNALLALLYILYRIPWVYAGNGSPLFTRLGIDEVLPRFDGAANLLNPSTTPLIISYTIVGLLLWRGYAARYREND